MQKLDDYINRVKHLPPAPVVLPKLLPLLGNMDTDSSRVVEVITYDPSLTASVLQLCNSAFFASATPATDIQEAVSRLGFNQVYRVVAAVSGSRALSSEQKGYGFSAGELWKHSVAAAMAAQTIAEDLDDDANTAFTAALLHDLGKVILAEALEHDYTKLVQETETNQQSLVEAEKKLLGVEHAEVGARLLTLWKFPASLIAAVCYHHQPASAAEEHQRLSSFVYLGNMVAHFMGFSYGHQAFAFRGRSESLTILNLSPEKVPFYMMKTFERLETIQSLFGKFK